MLTIILLLTGCGTVATSSAEVTGLALLHDRRDSSTLLSDEGIEMSADIELLKQQDLRNFTHINVTAYNGRVLLSGEAKTASLRAKIVSIVRMISGVKLVHNEIIIGPVTSFNSRTYDALITTKVKDAIADIHTIPGFDATRVKVVTENNTVFLMGLLHSSEGQATISKAQKIEGVKRVVPLFEYLD